MGCVVLAQSMVVALNRVSLFRFETRCVGDHMSTRTAPNDTTNFTNFGDAVRGACNEQCQYLVRHLAGIHGSKDLGSDLRWFGSLGDYHDVMIHKDDVGIFIRRYKAHTP